MKETKQRLTLLCFLFLNFSLKSEVENLFPTSEIGVIGALEPDVSQDSQNTLSSLQVAPTQQEAEKTENFLKNTDNAEKNPDSSVDEFLEEELEEESGGGVPAGAIAAGVGGAAALLGALGVGLVARKYLKSSPDGQSSTFYDYENDLEKIKEAKDKLKLILNADKDLDSEDESKMEPKERSEVHNVANLLNYIEENLNNDQVTPERKKALVDAYVPYLQEKVKSLPNEARRAGNSLLEVQIDIDFSNEYSVELRDIDNFKTAKDNIKEIENIILEEGFINNFKPKEKVSESEVENEDDKKNDKKSGKKKKSEDKSVEKLIKKISEDGLSEKSVDEFLKLLNSDNFEESDSEEGVDLEKFKEDLAKVAESQNIISKFNDEIKAGIKYESKKIDSSADGSVNEVSFEVKDRVLNLANQAKQKVQVKNLNIQREVVSRFPGPVRSNPATKAPDQPGIGLKMKNLFDRSGKEAATQRRPRG